MLAVVAGSLQYECIKGSGATRLTYLLPSPLAFRHQLNSVEEIERPTDAFAVFKELRFSNVSVDVDVEAKMLNNVADRQTASIFYGTRERRAVVQFSRVSLRLSNFSQVSYSAIQLSRSDTTGLHACEMTVTPQGGTVGSYFGVTNVTQRSIELKQVRFGLNVDRLALPAMYYVCNQSGALDVRNMEVSGMSPGAVGDLLLITNQTGTLRVQNCTIGELEVSEVGFVTSFFQVSVQALLRNYTIVRLTAGSVTNNISVLFYQNRRETVVFENVTLDVAATALRRPTPMLFYAALSKTDIGFHRGSLRLDTISGDNVRGYDLSSTTGYGVVDGDVAVGGDLVVGGTNIYCPSLGNQNDRLRDRLCRRVPYKAATVQFVELDVDVNDTNVTVEDSLEYAAEVFQPRNTYFNMRIHGVPNLRFEQNVGMLAYNVTRALIVY